MDGKINSEIMKVVFVLLFPLVVFVLSCYQRGKFLIFFDTVDFIFVLRLFFLPFTLAIFRSFSAKQSFAKQIVSLSNGILETKKLLSL